MITLSFVPITKNARAGKNGKQLCCPYCKFVRRVYHFSFSALECIGCKKDVEKLDFLIESTPTTSKN